MLNYDLDLPLLAGACASSALDIPSDIAIVSAGNNFSLCELGEIQLSSVDLNYRYHAYAAAALLDRLMQGHVAPQSPELIQPSRVVVRRSSDTFATTNPTVKSALAFMRANYATSSLRIADVVQASGASRRHLYTLFRNEMRKGVAEVLTSLRIEAAQRLLTDTDLKIISVAIQAGFSGHEHLIRCFVRVVGITPSEFRKQAKQASKEYMASGHDVRASQ
jgi:LacI family transcriptional regulator